MLDRIKVLSQLQSVQDQVFLDLSDEYQLARASFERIVADSLFQEKINKVTAPWAFPSWHDSLDTVMPIGAMQSPYIALAIDGSQIYPDRHQGTSCFLINTGTVILGYGMPPLATMHSIPQVYLHDDDEDESEANVDVVNCKRQELELQTGLETARLLQQQHTSTPLIFLFDGSLIFWHLESKELQFKQRYMSKYLAALDDLYRLRVPCVGYISMPKNKELTNLIRIELCNFELDGCTKHALVDHVLDTGIVRFFLEQNSTTTVFKSNASISSWYPAHLRPYFFYIDVGCEVARVEIPAWIADDKKMLALVAASILDQVNKGNGYPIALAEAHEQAVVKGPDREFFYHLITKLAYDKKQRLIHSQKSIKKRGLGV